MEDKLIELLYKNNQLLIDYILDKIQEEGYINNQEEIDIPQAIEEDSDWSLDDIKIERAIQQDKIWIGTISENILEIIEEDKSWTQEISEDIETIINEDKNWEVIS